MPLKPSKFMKEMVHNKGMGGISKEQIKETDKKTKKKKNGMFSKGRD